jgi:O-antigen/teichoic acid export membrane protein
MFVLKKIGMNSAWMLLGYLFRTGSAFITSVFVARYLGPEQYGEMNYVFSFVILFSMLSGTCFDQFLRREFVNAPDRTGDFLGTALTLKLFGAVVAIGLVFIFGVIPTDDLQTKWLLGIYSVSLIFMTSSLSQILLEAHLKSKYVTISEFFQLGVFLILKLLFVYQKFPLWTFVALQSTEVVLKGGGQFAWIARLKICPSLSVSKETAGYLVKESWPLFLSGSAAMIHQRIDQVMLRNMMSSTEVGFYAVAVKISSLMIFVPSILSRSSFPSLVNIAKKNKDKYEQYMGLYFCCMLWPMIFISILVYFTMNKPIQYLYGAEYAPVFSILVILTLKNSALSLSIATGDCILMNNLQRFAPIRQIVGVAINIGLNWVMIPRLGAYGAAISSLITYVCISIVLPLMIPSLRICSIFQLDALLFRSAINTYILKGNK